MDSEKRYLKDQEYYDELYDRGTIEFCRFFERHNDILSDNGKEANQLASTGKEKNHLEVEMVRLIMDMGMYFAKGQRYEKKHDTIRQWMARDGELDNLLQAVVEREVYCPYCHCQMFCTSKHFHDLDKKEIILMYDCPECGRAKAFYSNGKEFNPEIKCSKCSGLCTTSHIREPQKIISVLTCASCCFVENYEVDLSPITVKSDEEKKKENDCFLAERSKYCFGKEEAQNYFSSKIALDNFAKSLKKLEERDANKDLYDRVAAIKKLNVAGLRELLSEELIKNNYIQLELLNPEIDRITSTSFSVQDADANRDENNSRILLQKLIKTTLGPTNWRLMSDGLTYQLGILKGRLRGYDNEDELLNLINPKNKKPNNDYHPSFT